MSVRQMLTTLVAAFAGLLAAWSYRPQQPSHTASPAPNPLSVTVEAPGVRASTRASPGVPAHSPSGTVPAAVPGPASSAPVAGASGEPGPAGPTPGSAAPPAPTGTATPRPDVCVTGAGTAPATGAPPTPTHSEAVHEPTGSGADPTPSARVPDPAPTAGETPPRPVSGDSPPACPAAGTTPATGHTSPAGKPVRPLPPQTLVTVLPLWEAMRTDPGRKG
ncbi:hypothetical protein [Streptomyces eurythermus]|uniref:hypothetical protein n=1 Tax=Streptomyces eurythermus TaxID=42237 RepID=UPI0036D2E15F